MYYGFHEFASGLGAAEVEIWGFEVVCQAWGPGAKSMEDEGVLEVDFFLFFETGSFLRKIQWVEHVQDKGAFKGCDIFLHGYVSHDDCT